MVRREGGARKPAGISFDRLSELGYQTATGRRLEEVGAGGIVVSDPDELIPNTHTDSRGNFQDWPMNFTGLQHITRRTRDVTQGLAWINWGYYGFQDAVPDVVTATEASEMATIGIWAPRYASLRKRAPLSSHTLPETFAGVYKISQGIRGGANAIMQNDGEHKPVTGRMLYQATNSHEQGKIPLLASDEVQQVCPATDDQIIAFSDVLLTRRYLSRPIDPAESEFATIFKKDEFPRLQNFSLAAMELVFSAVENNLETTRLVNEYNNGGIVGPSGEFVRTPRIATRAKIEDTQASFEQTSRRLLARINRSLGRDPDTIR